MKTRCMKFPVLISFKEFPDEFGVDSFQFKNLIYRITEQHTNILINTNYAF